MLFKNKKQADDANEFTEEDREDSHSCGTSSFLGTDSSMKNLSEDGNDKTDQD